MTYFKIKQESFLNFEYDLKEASNWIQNSKIYNSEIKLTIFNLLTSIKSINRYMISEIMVDEIVMHVIETYKSSIKNDNV